MVMWGQLEIKHLLTTFWVIAPLMAHNEEPLVASSLK